MIVLDAREILEQEINKLKSPVEDDDGVWYERKVGEQLIGPWLDSRGEETEPDENAYAFIVYAVPVGTAIENLTEEERDEYGSMWCVDTLTGRTYQPEA